jgi:CheY-like chemotaxis protein
MIVEDEPAIRGLVSRTLEDEKYRVETAADGIEALENVREQQPDAIILDLALPVVDGWAVIDALDADDRHGKIPVIVVSARQRYANVGERGVHAFLSKPFELDTLLAVLEDLLPAEAPPAADGHIAE